MRGTVAKRIRNIARKNSEPTKWIKTKEGTVICMEYRAVYKELKRRYKKGEHYGS